jgi:acyl-homoserine lactone acylase PvdQ
MQQHFLHAIKGVLMIAFLLPFYIAQAQTSKTEILWDTYGVPHIYGKSQNLAKK